MMVPPVHVQPSVARPLFLEQEERRMQSGDPPPLGYPMATGFHQNMELRRNLEMMMEENKKLRERVATLEKSRIQEDPKFSTRDGNQRRPRPRKRL